MSNSPGQWNDGVPVASAAARLDHPAGNQNSRCLSFNRDSCPASRFVALLLNACHVFFGRYTCTEHIASGPRVDSECGRDGLPSPPFVTRPELQVTYTGCAQISRVLVIACGVGYRGTQSYVVRSPTETVLAVGSLGVFSCVEIFQVHARGQFSPSTKIALKDAPEPSSCGSAVPKVSPYTTSTGETTPFRVPKG
jgi:hypothetical protein